MNADDWPVMTIAYVNYLLGFIYDSFIKRLSIFVKIVIVLTADDRDGTVVRLCKQLSQLYYF